VYLPPYHLAQLALAQVVGGAVWGHLAYLLGTTIVGAIAAALAYRSAEA
jgi:ABC-2 type transport system permease protein